MSMEKSGIQLMEDARAHARLDAQERAIEAVSRNVGDLAHEMRAGFHALGEKFSSSRQTDWRSILAGVAVIIAIGGGVLSQVNGRMDSMQLIQNERNAQVRYLAEHAIDQITVHERLPGHLGTLISDSEARLNAAHLREEMETLQEDLLRLRVRVNELEKVE